MVQATLSTRLFRNAVITAFGLLLCFFIRIMLPRYLSRELPPRCFTAAAASTRIYEPRFTEADCPRAVCVHPNPETGLGHRLTNILQGALLAKSLGVLHATSVLEYASTPGFHGSYPGVNDLFRMPQVGAAGNGSSILLRCPFSAADLPQGWGAACLTLTANLRDSMVDSSAVQLAGMATACHTVYVAEEFWPKSYEAVVPLLRSMYKPDSATGIMLHAALRYDPTRFNIALHLRTGDIEPTPASYFVSVLALVLAELQMVLSRLPVDIWVFSESPAKSDLLSKQLDKNFGSEKKLRENNESLASIRVRTEATHDLPLLSVLVHLLKSDLFIGSDSSISWIVSWMTSSIAITPPRSLARGGGDHPLFRNFIAGNVPATNEGVFAHGRVLSAARLWLASQTRA